MSGLPNAQSIGLPDAVLVRANGILHPGAATSFSGRRADVSSPTTRDAPLGVGASPAMFVEKNDPRFVRGARGIGSTRSWGIEVGRSGLP
jgi:hypothetical protein